MLNEIRIHSMTMWRAIDVEEKFFKIQQYFQYLHRFSLVEGSFNPIRKLLATDKVQKPLLHLRILSSCCSLLCFTAIMAWLYDSLFPSFWMLQDSSWYFGRYSSEKWLSGWIHFCPLNSVSQAHGGSEIGTNISPLGWKPSALTIAIVLWGVPWTMLTNKSNTWRLSFGEIELSYREFLSPDGKIFICTQWYTDLHVS